MKSRTNTSRLAALLILGIVLAYLPALQGGYIWDDQEYVVHNSNLLSVEGLRNIWMEPRSMVMVQWYPLVHTVLWLQYRIWGLHPLGYHFVNVLLHALNAAILWAILRRMKVPGSWWVAAVFGLHPVQVESVAWITEIKNTLSGLFSLSAILAYLVYLDTRTGGTPDRVPAGRSRDSLIAYTLSLGFLLLALLSKPTAVAMPPTLLALTWWKSQRLRRSDILRLGPHFLLGAACGAFAWWLETIQVGASADEFSLSFLQRLLLAGRVIWFYPAKLVWPAELIFVYPRWSVDALVWWQYLFPLGAVAAILSLWFLRGRLGKGPLVAVLVYVINILPMAGFLNFYFMKFSYVGDHFQYLGGIGIMVLVIVPAARLIGSVGPDALSAVLASRVLPAAILMVLGSLTWGHAQVFRDEETIWRDTTAKNPSAWMPHVNLGDVLIDKGDIAGGIEQYRIVLGLAADKAGPFYSMGFALERQGKDQEAIRYYLRALEIEPNYGWAYYNIGEILEKQGNLADAESYYSAAVKRIPQSYWRSYKPLEKLGLLLARRGRLDKAARLLSRSLEINPGNVKLRAELHEILNRLNR